MHVASSTPLYEPALHAVHPSWSPLGIFPAAQSEQTEEPAVNATVAPSHASQDAEPPNDAVPGEQSEQTVSVVREHGVEMYLPTPHTEQEVHPAAPTEENSSSKQLTHSVRPPTLYLPAAQA